MSQAKQCVDKLKTVAPVWRAKYTVTTLLMCLLTYLVVSFSALTLLVGCEEERLACKEILSPF